MSYRTNRGIFAVLMVEFNAPHGRALIDYLRDQEVQLNAREVSGEHLYEGSRFWTFLECYGQKVK